jgi:heme oxygenase
MRRRTAALHREAERSGVVAAMLRGHATRAAYIGLLRNLVPVYRKMERALAGLSANHPLARLARPEMFRADALAADLAALAGSNWARTVRPNPAGCRYSALVARAVREDAGMPLLGHVYVRYLGDLNGGRILARLTAANLGLVAENSNFYAFPMIGDLDGFKAELRAAIDAAGRRADDPESVLSAAEAAFSANIALSRALQP